MLYYATIHCTVPEGLDDGVDGQAAGIRMLIISPYNGKRIFITSPYNATMHCRRDAPVIIVKTRYIRYIILFYIA